MKPNPHARVAGEHPSEYQLDQYALGELEEGDQARLEHHLARCSWCKNRNSLRAEGMGGFPEVDAERVLRRLKEHAGHDKASRCSPRSNPLVAMWRHRAARYMAGGAVAFAVMALIVLQPRSASPPSTEDKLTAVVDSAPELRAKGLISLRVFRRDNGRVQEMLSRDRFRAGDRIRFALAPASGDVWADKHVMIVGAEDSGGISVYYPSTGVAVSALPSMTADGALAGTIELDDFIGTEWLVLVACPQSFSRDDIGVSRSERSATPPVITVPARCESATFAMNKR
ncbi:MAG: zf-HC2 domain-containing protein [Proteobacteria bacterium]|nr:zf-HC2 domain-containing protein [Pseudomonadota bacterium]